MRVVDEKRASEENGIEDESARESQKTHAGWGWKDFTKATALLLVAGGSYLYAGRLISWFSSSEGVDETENTEDISPSSENGLTLTPSTVTTALQPDHSPLASSDSVPTKSAQFVASMSGATPLNTEFELLSLENPTTLNSESLHTKQEERHEPRRPQPPLPASVEQTHLQSEVSNAGCATPVGNEFMVSTYAVYAPPDYPYSQTGPAIASLSTGGFAVALSNSDGSDDGIYVQHYDANGIRKGGGFLVNTYTQGRQLNPAITSLFTGDFVVTWTSRGQDDLDYGIYAQRYGSDGVPKSTEFRVNTFTHSYRDFSAITSLPTGDFVVTWHGYGQGSLSRYGIYAQRYGSDGTPKGSEFQVNTYMASHDYFSAITSISTGGFVVTWQSNRQDGSGYGIYAQRYNSDGVRQGTEFQVNTDTQGSQRYSAITSLPTGGFIIAWNNYNPEELSPYGVYTQRYEAGGVKRGSELHVVRQTQPIDGFPALTSLSSGGFVVVWAGNTPTDLYYELYAKHYDADGLELGDTFQVNTYTYHYQWRPAITDLPNENFVVIWDSVRQWIRAQRYNVTLANANDAPNITNAVLSLVDGEEVILAPEMLNINDPDSASSDLTWTMSNVAHGHFAMLSVSTAPITTFTQQQIINGEIVFQHDGSYDAPGFDAVVSDGEFTTPVTSATITFSVRLTLLTNNIVIQEGERLVLTTAHLNSVDIDNNVDELMYTVRGLSHIHFEHTGALGVAITQFTQEDINVGTIVAIHDGSETAPNFTLALADSLGSLSPVEANVVFTPVNDAPVLSGFTLRLKEADVVPLTLSLFAYTDTDTALIDLTVSITQVTHGHFALATTPATPRTSFTLAQVSQGAMVFVHDGGELAPRVTLQLSDGQYSTAERGAAIDWQGNINDAPALTSNILTLTEANPDDLYVILSRVNVMATDVDTPESNLSFQVSHVQHGYFASSAHPNQVLTSFTLMEIEAGQIRFYHDGGEVAPRYDVRAWDGQDGSPIQAANILFDNFNDAPYINQPLPNIQEVTVNRVFDYTVPATTFADPEQEPLALSARQSDGSALPREDDFNVLFNPSTHTFSGIIRGLQTLSITITATDPQAASTNATFELAAVPPSVPSQVKKTLFEIVLPSIGGALLSGLGLWARRRNINNQWKNNPVIIFHDALRSALRLNLGIPNDSALFIQEVNHLLDAFMEQGIDMSHLTHHEQQRYASAVAEVVEDLPGRTRTYSRLFHGCCSNPLNICSPSYDLAANLIEANAALLVQQTVQRVNAMPAVYQEVEGQTNTSVAVEMTYVG